MERLGLLRKQIAVIGQKNKGMAEFQVRTMADCMAMGETPEVLFWVGCAGSFDDFAQSQCEFCHFG